MDAVAILATLGFGFMLGVFTVGGIFAWLVTRDDKAKKAVRSAAYGDEIPAGRIEIDDHSGAPILH